MEPAEDSAFTLKSLRTYHLPARARLTLQCHYSKLDLTNFQHVEVVLQVVVVLTWSFVSRLRSSESYLVKSSWQGAGLVAIRAIRSRIAESLSPWKSLEIVEICSEEAVEFRIPNVL
jgi:hypothetical protein